MTAVTITSTTCDAPITLAATESGAVLITLPDGTAAVYEAEDIRQAYRVAVKYPEARRTIDDLFAKHGIDDPNQARRLIRERFSQEELDAYVRASKILYAAGELG